MNIPAFDAALNYLKRVECMEFGDYTDAFFFLQYHIPLGFPYHTFRS